MEGEQLVTDNRIAVTSGEEFEFIRKYAESKGLKAEKKYVYHSAPEEFEREVKGYPAVLVGGEKYTDEILNSLKDSLKILTRFGVGYDNIDYRSARKYNIAVSNTPGGNSAGVADQAMMFMLALGRATCRYDRQIRQNCWDKTIETHELIGKTVGLIGFGHIARLLRQYLSGFECRVLVMDDYVDDATMDQHHVIRATMDEIAEQSDYISLHVPLTDATRGMIDRAFLQRMKKTAYLINTCRGEVVKEADLTEALQRGEIAGAGLDVLEKEPSDADNPLFQMDQVILSPHVSFNTKESNERTAQMAIDEIAEYLATGHCKYIVN